MKWWIVLIVIALVVICVIAKRHKRSDAGKIYETTDGYFTQNPKIKKRRRVAVLKQRKDDGALAVAKIYSKEGKNLESGAYIKDLTLQPEKHKSLKQESIVGNQVYIGTKDKKGGYKPIYKGDFIPTKDRLTKKERLYIVAEIQNDNPRHRKTHEDKMKNWENHFKEK